MTDQPVDEYAARPRSRSCSRVPACSAPRGGATCTAIAPTFRPSSPSSTTSACTRSTTRSSRRDAPAGVTGHHFRHYPRPGQGIVTGRPTVGLSLVLISPKEPARAQELRDWADFVHIRHIAEAAVPGYCMITPYENVTGGDPRFMHFYEMDTDDPETAFKVDDAARDASASATRTPTRSSAGPGDRACASCTSTRSSASARATP